jgi:TonB family protein
MKRGANVAMTALLLVCGAAQAAEWVSVGKNADGAKEMFVDVASIKVTGDIRLAWLKGAAAHHAEKGVGAHSGNWVAYDLSRFSFNCGDETSVTEAGLIYYDDGTQETLPAYSLSSLSEPVAPDTMLHAAMEFTCSWKPTAQTGDLSAQNGGPTSSDVDRSTARQGARTIQLPDCPKDYYPAQDLRQGHHGAVVVRVCIGIDNKIDGPVEIMSSSGFPSLDEAAAKCMAAGRYRAGTLNGAPARTCKDFKLTFSRNP